MIAVPHFLFAYSQGWARCCLLVQLRTINFTHAAGSRSHLSAVATLPEHSKGVVRMSKGRQVAPGLFLLVISLADAHLVLCRGLLLLEICSGSRPALNLLCQAQATALLGTRMQQLQTYELAIYW